MEDVDVFIQKGDIEACHRIRKSDKKTSSKKAIVRFEKVKKSLKKLQLTEKSLLILTVKRSTTSAK